MLDLSTINATTIADPLTIQKVEANVRALQKSREAVDASILRNYLERQVTANLDSAVAAKYQSLIQDLANIKEISKENLQIEPDATERIPVNDGSGRLKIFSGQGFVEMVQPKPDEPLSRTDVLPNSVLLRQAAINQTSDDRPVPVAYDLPEDEEEIRKHANRLSSFNLDDGHDIAASLDRIIAEQELKFSDEVMMKRFRTIGESRLKEIRTSREVRELFVRPPKIGGLGLGSEKADAVILSLEQGADEIREGLSAVMPKAVSTVPTPIPAPPKIPKEAVLPPVTPPLFIPPAPAVVVPIPTQSSPLPPPAPKPAPVAPPPPFKPILNRPAVQSYRPLVEDIRAPVNRTRLVGPLEELGALGVDDFRRWGSGDAAASVRKVYEKIALLGEESFGRRVEGVAQWKQSPVYALYLEMSQASLEQSKDIRTIVSARESAGQPVLSEAEFHAIIDLNRQLRF